MYGLIYVQEPCFLGSTECLEPPRGGGEGGGGGGQDAICDRDPWVLEPYQEQCDGHYLCPHHLAKPE
jgi:hypothetical protein